MGESERRDPMMISTQSKTSPTTTSLPTVCRRPPYLTSYGTSTGFSPNRFSNDCDCIVSFLLLFISCSYLAPTFATDRLPTNKRARSAALRSLLLCQPTAFYLYALCTPQQRMLRGRCLGNAIYTYNARACCPLELGL